MASGYPGRDLLHASFSFGGAGSAVHVPYQHPPQPSMKRPLTEQEIQQAIFLRSVRQKGAFHPLASPISPLSPIDLSAVSSSSSSVTTNGAVAPNSADLAFQRRQQQNPNSAVFSFSAEPDSDKKSTMRNRLEELEKQLLDDDDDDDDVSVAGAGSAVTMSEWSETIQHLVSPPLAPTQTSNALSPSPTSSSTSSSASCSPPSTSAPPPRQLLLDTAAAIADGSLDSATVNLAALKRAANPRGDPDQRLTAIMLSALISRLNGHPTTGISPIADLCTADHQSATQLLHDLSPAFKLAISAANLAILDATRDDPAIHVVDFDVGHGSQYAALISALADRRRLNPPAVKITAVIDPTSPFNSVSTAVNLRLLGEKISKLAERVGLSVRFGVVTRQPAELDRATLGVDPGEALAVNFAFLLSRIADESVSPANPRDELLRRVRRLEPRVVTLVEQEMNGNTAPFAARFGEAVAHYGAILESLDASVGRDAPERTRVEGCLARKATNTVAREGPDRVERCEVLGKWRARMGMAGFKPVPLGPAVVEPVKSRLATGRPNPGFTVKEEAGGIAFGWMGRVLVVASAWR